MTMLRGVLVAILACAAMPAAAATFKDDAAFIASITDALPEQSLSARGDLNGDGREDAAVVVTSGKDAGERHHQLFVLLRGAAGALEVAAASQKAPVAGMGCCWVDSLAIRNGSVYLQNNAKSACDIEAAVHQFKRYRGAWRLLGVKITDYRHCDDKGDADIEAGIDHNVLTGTTHHWHRNGGEPVRRWTTRQPPRAYLLCDYDFFNGFGTPDE